MASTKILLKLSIFILFYTTNFFSSLEASTFVTNTSNSNDDVVSCIYKERKALLKFKEGIVDPSNFLSSWNGSDCCKWRGVTCNYRTGQVLKLNLSSNSFSGMVPPSLGNLSNLRVLNLSSNSFSGMIPPSLGNLSNLRVLDLSSNRFSGIPPSLGNLNLRSYKLWVSDLNWLSGLSSLEFLDLSFVNLSLATTHWLQAVNMLPSLSELYLFNTNLRNIPVSLSHLNLSSLSVLDLSINNFSTQPPQWLFNISSLTVLNLRECHFNGPISTIVQGSGFCSFQKLDLSYNELSGRIDELVEGSLSRCGNNSLEELYLGVNQLSGQLPNSLAHLKYLRTLDLFRNLISGPLPKSIGGLLKLERLDLGVNKLNGPISTIVQGSGFCSFQKLDLSYNELSGRIDELVEGSLSRCGNNSLEELYLGFNQLSGQLPNSLAHLKYLRTLDLSYNSISGPLPKSIGGLLKLEWLDLSFNKMNGSIPKSLGKRENLQELSLEENDWEGVISEDYFQELSKLKVLGISSTKPSFVWNLSSNWVPPFSLTFLHVWDIKLGPKFPLWLQTQTQIEYLSLGNVSISEKIPNWFWNMCGHIRQLSLSDNQIRGTIPQRSVVFPSDAEIYLSNNAIEGPLPLWPNVSYLDLSNNSFSGPIPSDIGHIMSQLETLILSSNSLNGSIPSSLGTMKNLGFLDIKKNHLFGEVHDNWKGENIMGIDLSMNNLSGNIPASLCSSPSLIGLKLSKNMFSGELPSSLKNCKDLSMLDLGGNRISGRIPEWIGESLSLLQELSLQGNLFNGRISKKLCHLQELHVLDLGQNNLSGPIPPCLGNLSTMKSTTKVVRSAYFDMVLVLKGRESVYDSILRLVKLIDLSNNILSGYVPEDITNLSGLISLNLSNNHLTGEIPHRIGELQKLETLDLSSNLFSGQIPQSMNSMTFLSNLNLSHNNLSGPIPSGTQFSTFQDKSIYEGNSGLCGGPLPNQCTQDVVNEDGDHQHRGQDEVKKEDKEEMLGLYVSITLGFFVGFWSICGSLVINKSWRDAYYGFLYKMKDYIIVLVAVKVNQCQRMIEKIKN